MRTRADDQPLKSLLPRHRMRRGTSPSVPGNTPISAIWPPLRPTVIGTAHLHHLVDTTPADQAAHLGPPFGHLAVADGVVGTKRPNPREIRKGWWFLTAIVGVQSQLDVLLGGTRGPSGKTCAAVAERDGTASHFGPLRDRVTEAAK